MAEKLDEGELKALLSREIQSAVTYDQTELSQRRTRALEYYQGVMRDIPAQDGRSSLISTDVADTIGWMLPGIVRVFTASDQMAKFDPQEPGDEAFAEMATDYCNYIFWKDNPGYRIMWDATHDSLLMANGVVKHWWDDTEECKYSEHSGLDEEQIALMQMEGDVEIVAQKPGEPQIVPNPETGEPVEIQTYDIKVKRVTSHGRVRIECVMPEDFLMDRNAITIDKARFTAHRRETTRSELIEMGFDKEIVESLPAYHVSTFASEKLARRHEFRSYNDIGDEATTLIELYECYIRADADGDGISEILRAYYVGEPSGGELLDWEVWDDDVPFSDIPCEPVPHRWEARSVTDDTMDLQRAKTVLTRQMMDNLYASNLPQREAEEGSIINPEALVSPKFGGVIWRKKGAQPVAPHAVPFVADKVLGALQHFDNVREMRTGVSRSTMALDPEALVNQTATANQNQKDASYSQIELIARNQAELGWTRVFKQVLKLVVKHQDRPRVIRLRDDWVQIDPRHWNTEMDVTINVGLGTGSRDRDMAMLAQILTVQKEMAAMLAEAGMMDLAMEMAPKIVRTARMLTEAAGIRNAESYWPQLDEERMAQIMQQKAQEGPPPDPKAEEAKAKIEMEQQRFQMEAQKAQAQMQMDGQMAQAKMQTEAEMRQQDMAMKREQLVMEMELKREQLAAELALKREQITAELALKREAGFVAADTKVATSRVAMGGEPG